MSCSLVADPVAHSSSTIVSMAVKGSHVMKIDGYSRTKGLGIGKNIKSDPFNIGGHPWRIMFYPDGYRKEDDGWISLYLYLAESSAPGVQASYSFSLLDGAGEPVPRYCAGDADVIRTFRSANSGWGVPRFIERKVLEGEASKYLKDDCFMVRCDVIVSNGIRTPRTPEFVMAPVPPSDMNQHFGRLLASRAEADVFFLVGEETFAAHRIVLGARSSVFMAELFGGLKEWNSHVVIDDMQPRVFRALLHFIYNDALPEMDKGDNYVMAQHLLVAANRYGLERLKLMCEHMLRDGIDTSVVATTLLLAEQHGCKGLKQACFKFLMSPGNLRKIMDTDEFRHLTSCCPSLLNELLASIAP